ncbi:MAG: preprotein translocase subunit SecE [Spirochaetota bacterium]
MNQLIEYLKGAREEFGKIVWPQREEVTRFTFVTILTVVIVSLFLWLVDSALMKLINLVMK